MTRLQELFLAIKEENLDKWQLEKFYSEMSDLYAQMHLTMAEVKKRKALFLVKDPEKPTASVKRAWDATEDGLLEIDLKGKIRATAAHLRSLKNRMYTNY